MCGLRGALLWQCGGKGGGAVAGGVRGEGDGGRESDSMGLGVGGVKSIVQAGSLGRRREV